MKSLLEIVYTGSIEATMAEMRRMLILAHSLYISVPVSDQLMKMLGLTLPPLPTLPWLKPKPPPQAEPVLPAFSPSKLLLLPLILIMLIFRLKLLHLLLKTLLFLLTLCSSGRPELPRPGRDDSAAAANPGPVRPHEWPHGAAAAAAPAAGNGTTCKEDEDK